MTTPRLQLDEIPYREDASTLFETLRQRPGAAWLDSAQPAASGGRYDIMVADPMPGCPRPPAATAQAAAWRSWLEDLKAFHSHHWGNYPPTDPPLPFCGGLLGYLGYEAGSALEGIAVPCQDPVEVAAPVAQVQGYRWCVVQDHLLRRALLVSQSGLPASEKAGLLRALQAAPTQPPPALAPGFALQRRFEPTRNRQWYRQAFERIQDYIHAGDCYQVNLAQRFTAACEGDPWLAYQTLRRVAAAPFSAFISLDQQDALLCLSPERFLSLQGHQVETRPIKGTRPRNPDAAEDLRSAQSLKNSTKDRAENLMIVDLLRNDLGRNCLPGSIRVDALFALESYPTVHHLVSTIRGELAPGRHALDLLRDSFPGGSITGAPKHRAMQIIAELEACPREAYCGSVFYLSADGRMDSNIAIRSLLCQDGELRCWGGGGIVADSQADAEYQETLDKVGRLLAALEERFL